VPITFAERFFTCLVVFVGVVFFGFNVSRVMEHFDDLHQLKETKDTISDISKVMLKELDPQHSKQYKRLQRLLWFDI
jgi:hypothetical protein